MAETLEEVMREEADPKQVKTLAEMGRELLKLRKKIAPLKAQLKALADDEEKLEAAIIVAMEKSGFESVKVDKQLFTKSSTKYYSMPAAADEENRAVVIRWLKQIRLGGFIHEEINSSRLSGLMRDREAAKKPIHKLLAEKAYEKKVLSVRK